MTHVRLDVFPAGGLARLRVNGEIDPEALRVLGALSIQPARRAPASTVRRRAVSRPDGPMRKRMLGCRAGRRSVLGVRASVSLGCRAVRLSVVRWVTGAGPELRHPDSIGMDRARLWWFGSRLGLQPPWPPRPNFARAHLVQGESALS